MFYSLFDVMGTSSVSILIAFIGSVFTGLLLALVYKACETTTKSFLITTALLPAIVMIVIMMVNGNIGVGVAVAGSFSLVRFRSLPGKASDILIIFVAMACGLATGMGYVILAIFFAILVSIFYLIFAKTNLFVEDKNYRSIRITIPEDLEYNEVFRDIFEKYTTRSELKAIRTVNLGTMYQITYDIQLVDEQEEKHMMDAIRTRNGNLSVISGRVATTIETSL